MKTEEQIRNEYIKKVTEFSQKQDDKYKAAVLAKGGTMEEKSKSVTVTDICAWDTYCPKKVYFDKTAKRPATPESLIRMTIGNVVHEIPLWNNDDPELDGFEQSFYWNGIRCRMDEIDVIDGIIIDKKTVPALSIKPKEYVTKQLNIYRVIAEDNKERPIKINQLFVINLVVINGKIQVLEVPMWDKEETLKYIERVRSDIKRSVETRTPPDVACGSKGWMCDGCQYVDLCMGEAVSEPQTPKSKQMALDDDKAFGIVVKKGRKK